MGYGTISTSYVIGTALMAGVDAALISGAPQPSSPVLIAGATALAVYGGLASLISAMNEITDRKGQQPKAPKAKDAPQGPHAAP